MAMYLFFSPQVQCLLPGNSEHFIFCVLKFLLMFPALGLPYVFNNICNFLQGILFRQYWGLNNSMKDWPWGTLFTVFVETCLFNHFFPRYLISYSPPHGGRDLVEALQVHWELSSRPTTHGGEKDTRYGSIRFVHRSYFHFISILCDSFLLWNFIITANMNVIFFHLN